MIETISPAGIWRKIFGERTVMPVNRNEGSLPDVGDEAVPCLDVQRPSRGPEDQGGEVARPKVAFDGWAQRKVGQDVTVVGNERLVSHKRFHVFNAAARVEEDGFVTVFDRQFAVVRAGQQAAIGLRAVVGIDGKRRDAIGDQVIESKCDERFAVNGDERFRAAFGEGPQPGSQTGTEHERLHRPPSASAAQAAPNPLSIFTTVTLLLQLVSMPRSAAMPPRLAP